MKTLDFVEGKRLPLDILMQPIFFGGGRGSGKTTGAKKLYEAGHAAGAQCITIAPVGKWWSLRLGPDGKSPGLRDVFVFGGKHGDVPITPDSGATISKLLVEKRIHAVIDVSLMRKGERCRFLADFLEEFWLLKKLEDESYPVVLFLEEAHAIVPQKPQPNEARMLGAAEDLVREGRNHGVGVVLLDQRSAVVNKNVLALVEVLMCLRTIHNLDRDAFEAWVVEKGSEHGEWLAELPGLKAGDAFIYAPLLDIFERVHIKMIDTFDATKTATIGERVAKVGTLAPVDVEALRAQLGNVIEEAERNNPRALQRRIAELQAELAKKQPPAAEPVEVQVSIKKELDVLQTTLERIALIGDQLAQKQQVVVACVGNAVKALEPTFTRPMRTLTAGPPPGIVVENWPKPPVSYEKKNGTVTLRGTVPTQRGTVVLPREARPPATAGGLSEKGYAMLCEIVGAGTAGLSRPEVAMRVGLRYNRNFRNYQSELKTAGLIETPPGDRIVATDAAKKLVGGAGRLKRFSELRELWRPLLSGHANGMLDALITQKDGDLTREQLAASVGLGYNRNFRNYQSELNTASLIELTRESVRLNPNLYVGGA